MICTQTQLAADMYPLLEQTSNDERRGEDLQIGAKDSRMKPLSPQSLERNEDGLRDSSHYGLYNSNRRFFAYFRTHGEIKGRAQLRFRMSPNPP